MAGETLVFYGSGFGPVLETNNAVAGQVATGLTTLSVPVQFSIGGVNATVTYAGFTPDLVGLYQFNVVVPANVPSGDQPLVVSVNGDPIAQTLFLSVQ